MHGVVLVRRECARHAVRGVQVVVPLKAPRGGLHAGPGAALAPQSLVGHGALVHSGVVGVAQLGRRGHPTQPGHQRARGEVGGEVLVVGQPVHGLHGGDGAAGVGRHACPGVAADVLQAHGAAGLRPLGGAGVHAGLPLAALAAVGPGGQAQALGVAQGPVVVVVLAGRALQVGLLVAVLAGGAVVFHWEEQEVTVRDALIGLECTLSEFKHNVVLKEKGFWAKSFRKELSPWCYPHGYDPRQIYKTF